MSILKEILYGGGAGSGKADALRRAASMKLFERDGRIHYGTWRRWWNAGSKQERDAILKTFNEEK